MRSLQKEFISRDDFCFWPIQYRNTHIEAQIKSSPLENNHNSVLNLSDADLTAFSGEKYKRNQNVNKNKK